MFHRDGQVEVRRPTHPSRRRPWGHVAKPLRTWILPAGKSAAHVARTVPKLGADLQRLLDGNWSGRDCIAAALDAAVAPEPTPATGSAP